MKNIVNTCKFWHVARQIWNISILEIVLCLVTGSVNISVNFELHNVYVAHFWILDLSLPDLLFNFDSLLLNKYWAVFPFAHSQGGFRHLFDAVILYYWSTLREVVNQYIFQINQFVSVTTFRNITFIIKFRPVHLNNPPLKKGTNEFN